MRAISFRHVCVGATLVTPDVGAALATITPGGVASIVLEHLGSDAVRGFVDPGSESGSVSIMVQLQGKGRHHFAVRVFSPDHTGSFDTGTCLWGPDREGEGDSTCVRLENGTTVTTKVSDEGFTDDNVDGMVISETAMTPDVGAALAMYERYDDSAAVSAADLGDLLADPRLTWLTDPWVNEAGAAVDVKESGRWRERGRGTPQDEGASTRHPWSDCMSGGDWKDRFDAACRGDVEQVRFHLEPGVDMDYAHPEF